MWNSGGHVMSDFIQYLQKIIPAPVRIKNIDGYVYEISSDPSILNERCVEGRISDKIYKRLKNCRKIEAITTWNNNKLKVRFKK
jgi:hypothetical protein